MLGFVLNGQHHIQNSQWNLTRSDLHEENTGPYMGKIKSNY
jgi:hypothetical protein